MNGFKQALEGYSRDIKIVEIVENYDDDFLSFEVTKNY